MAGGNGPNQTWHLNVSGEKATVVPGAVISGGTNHIGHVFNNNNDTVDEAAATSAGSSLSLWDQDVIKPDMSNVDWLEEVDLKDGEISKEDKDGPHYKMSSIPRGHALIINNVNFKDKARRDGADCDAKNLKSFFEKGLQFGDFMDYEEDLTLQDMLKQLRRLQRYDYLEVDSMLLIISSHGCKEGVWTKDGKVLKYQEIINMFSDKECPKLKGKPKLIFMLCCRGELKPMSGDQTDNVTVPDDILVAFATKEEYVSYRNSEHGTYFGQNLVLALSKYANSKDLVSILDYVNELTMSQPHYTNPNNGPYRQEPDIVNGLRYKLYLNFPDEVKEEQHVPSDYAGQR